LIGDPERLQQILLNLIGNAIKFTQTGEIVIRVDQSAEAAKAPLIRFMVSDTGAGIAASKLDLIFDTLTHGPSPITETYGGSGVGLAIAKRLVELMNGRMWVESKAGFGSTFFFTADLGVQAEPQRSLTAPLNDISELRILIIDDNATTRMVLREALLRCGVSVNEASSGADGLAELGRASAANTPYQMVLLDCRMPEMDGFEVAAQIQSNLRLPVAIILMLTSDIRSGDLNRAREMGVTTILVKPVK
jgi:CheY-like chemotaxis protein/anti-sigma regulatory factor (Ser/Thr protein kinase)